MKSSVKNNIVVLLLIAVTVGTLSLFFGGGANDKLVYSEGRPWNYPKLIATFDVPIEYDSLSAKAIRDSVAANFAPIYNVNSTVGEQAVAQITSRLGEMENVTPATRKRLLEAVEQVYGDGIVDNNTRDRIEERKLSRVRIINKQGNEATTTGVSHLRSMSQAYNYIDSVAGVSLSNGPALSQLVHSILRPNMEYDSVRSASLLDEANKLALAPHGVKVTGERIIDYGEIVTPQKYTLLKTYERMNNEQNLNTTLQRFSRLGNIVVLALLMLSLMLFVKIMYPAVMRNLRQVTFLFSFVFVFVAVVYIIAHFRAGLLYMVPFALVPIVVTIFFDTPLGFFTHMVVVLISSLVAPEAGEFLIMQFLAGTIAIVSIKGLTQRSQLVLCAVLIFLGYTIIYVAQYVARNGTLASLDWHIILYFALNAIVLSFANFIIYVIEKIFGFTSQVTLVELSDINNEVLRELSENCPGTFQHSLQVATLGGEAAREIGANVQLVRAGALYHDIGKISNPAFFTENQTGVNPHDVLQPEQSASIVISHVKDGLERASHANLPQVIKDLIAQHHGTSRTRYFYSMACKAHPDETVDPAPYTYPGPNPQTAEAAILMMADACEAAVKSIPLPNEENITAMVNKIIDSQLSDGMFDEAPITLRDIGIVKKSLIKRLLTFYHTRVSYPDDVRPGDNSADDSADARE